MNGFKSEPVDESGAPGRALQGVASKAQGAAAAREAAGIGNAARRRLGRPSGCAGFVHRFSILLSVSLALCVSAAQAALDVGDRAPNFTADAALGGKTFKYSLADALAKGPVVLYFFPAAFSEDCSIEAHEFAEAVDRYAALGASVVGVSGDDLELISRFSAKVCQGKFPVVADEKHQVIKAFDTAMQTRPEYANRVSYVIAPDGTVIYTYLSLNPHRHVERTLAALQQWRNAQPR